MDDPSLMHQVQVQVHERIQQGNISEKFHFSVNYRDGVISSLNSKIRYPHNSRNHLNYLLVLVEGVFKADLSFLVLNNTLNTW
jgi:hypothetical protein